jgi:AcrR family transcriptional regulator
MTGTPHGRRERKKAATRQSIADAALRLFLERGYDEVSVRDIADEADVSTTTLFKHFAGKEALVFDETGRESRFVQAVQEREGGQSVLDALRAHALAAYADVARHPQAAAFQVLVSSTPELREYSERMWTRHTGSLGAAIAEQIGAPIDDVACTALARYVLDIPALIRLRPDAAQAIQDIFALLAHGWTARVTHEPRA